MRVMIRPAEPGDGEIIAAFIQEMAVGDGECSPLTPEYARRYLAHPGSAVLLAELNGQAAGLLSYSLRPDLYHAGQAGLIEALIVRKEVEGQGVGSALLRAVIEQAQAEGWAELAVGVMPGNERALRLYKKHGLDEEAVLLERHFGN